MHITFLCKPKTLDQHEMVYTFLPPFSLRLHPSSVNLPVQTTKMLPVWPSRRGQVINYLHKMVVIVMVQQCEETEKRAEDRNNESECPADMG